MALKPTIFKFKVSLSDINNDYYDELNLILAQHPSENVERMMARSLAFCLNAFNDAEKRMAFTKGLSSVDEPDIWLKSLDDQTLLWIDIGEPSFDRLKKACRLAKKTVVYTFNSKSDVWWKQSQADLDKLPISVVQFEWEQIKAFSQHLSRTMDFSITLSEQTAYVALNDSQIEVNWRTLKD
jgi:uncharacterized protein YaeQ